MITLPSFPTYSLPLRSARKPPSYSATINDYRAHTFGISILLYLTTIRLISRMAPRILFRKRFTACLPRYDTERDRLLGALILKEATVTIKYYSILRLTRRQV